MNKPIVAVDIDEVLADGAESFVRFSNQQWGTGLTVDDYQEHWSDMWQVEHEEVERRADIWHASGEMGKHTVKMGSTEALLELKNRYRLVVTTSRRLLLKDETLDWLERNYHGVFDAVHFAGIFDRGLSELEVYSHTKAALYTDIGAAYVIDDQPKHCIAAAQNGLVAIPFGEYPWNEGVELHQNVVRCRDWQAVLEYFDIRNAAQSEAIS